VIRGSLTQIPEATLSLFAIPSKKTKILAELWGGKTIRFEDEKPKGIH
jgi:hypothetical protein